MDEKLRAGRIHKDIEQPVIEELEEKIYKDIRPEKIFGMNPKQLFLISLEIFLLVLFVGTIILFVTGKITFK